MSRFEVPFPRYGRKRSFARIETGFMTFVVLFLELWMLLRVNWRYRCQDTGENIHSPFSKLVLSHCCVIFSTLDVILSRSDVYLPRYM